MAPEASNRTHRTHTKKRRRSWREPFLEALRELPNVRDACLAAGIARSTAYLEREQDPNFAAAWDEAVEDGCDLLEKALFTRAVRGVTKTIFYQGEPCGEETAFSDTAAIFLLKGHRPEKYRERADVTSGDQPISVQLYLPQNSRDEPKGGDDPPAGG